MRSLTFGWQKTLALTVSGLLIFALVLYFEKTKKKKVLTLFWWRQTWNNVRERRSTLSATCKVSLHLVPGGKQIVDQSLALTLAWTAACYIWQWGRWELQDLTKRSTVRTRAMNSRQWPGTSRGKVQNWLSSDFTLEKTLNHFSFIYLKHHPPRLIFYF